MKRTKILATLGPSSLDAATIAALRAAGADGFRVNMSHGSHEQWRSIIAAVRAVAPEVPVVMDTKGPEVRLLGVTEDILMTSDDPFIFSVRRGQDLPFLSFSLSLRAGMQVLFDDGAIVTEVMRVRDGVVTVRTVSGGLLRDARKVTVPAVRTEFPIVDAKDRHDLRFCKEMEVDAIALSFCRSARDVATCRRIMGADVMVIAKIENAEGVERIEEIIEAADAVMVARGDLGVELPFRDVPLLQKRIVRACNARAKPVIVATQMLESMTVHPKPTRAEVSDVANAILDGADCVMLSAETAIGEHPVESVSVMASIAERVDPTLETVLPRVSSARLGVAEAMSNAVYDLSLNVQVQAIVTATSSGFTARMVSRFRPRVPLIGVTEHAHVARHLMLSWGVQPCLFSVDARAEHRTVLHAVLSALAAAHITKSDVVVVAAGVDTRHEESTNLIEVHQVADLLASGTV